MQHKTIFILLVAIALNSCNHQPDKAPATANNQASPAPKSFTGLCMQILPKNLQVVPNKANDTSFISLPLTWPDEDIYDLRWKQKDITVSFWGGEQNMNTKIFSIATEWEQYANIHFVRLPDGTCPSDISIGFIPGGTAWSQVGIYSRSTPNKPSMCYGLDGLRPDSPDSVYRSYVLHEFGHAIGLMHEQQNPKENIPWNIPEVYYYYITYCGWDSAKTKMFVLDKLDDQWYNSTAWDKHSIMQYNIPKWMVLDSAYAAPYNWQISDTDKVYIQKLYPFDKVKHIANKLSQSKTSPARPRL